MRQTAAFRHAHTLTLHVHMRGIDFRVWRPVRACPTGSSVQTECRFTWGSITNRVPAHGGSVLLGGCKIRVSYVANTTPCRVGIFKKNSRPRHQKNPRLTGKKKQDFPKTCVAAFFKKQEFPKTCVAATFYEKTKNKFLSPMKFLLSVHAREKIRVFY